MLNIPASKDFPGFKIREILMKSSPSEALLSFGKNPGNLLRGWELHSTYCMGRQLLFEKIFRPDSF